MRYGTLNFLDNSLDRASGTIHARATVPNSDLLLTPGEFGRVRVNLQASHQVLLVPDAAVSVDQTDRDGSSRWSGWCAQGKEGADRRSPLRLARHLFRTCSFGPSRNRRTAGNAREKYRPRSARLLLVPMKGATEKAMKLAHFFIEHPRFAIVLNVFIVLAGLATMFSLPITQYPNIVPPTIKVTTLYPGASADVIARTVATPLEQAINGVEGMEYISSQSTGNGQLTITVIFTIGSDADIDLCAPKRAFRIRSARLPQEVQFKVFRSRRRSTIYCWAYTFIRRTALGLPNISRIT